MTQEAFAQEEIGSQVPPSSEVLNMVAEAVNPKDITGPDAQASVDRLLQELYANQGDGDNPKLVGIAAPQLGISKRIIVIRVNPFSEEKPDFYPFINPEIIETSEEAEEGPEGCFSTGFICGIVERAKTVTIKAFDREGQQVVKTFEGFQAREALHEIDHLDGIRFPDKIPDSKLQWVEPEKFGRYRQEWASWPFPCSRETWEKMKAGNL